MVKKFDVAQLDALLDEMGKRLSNPVEAYLIGGLAMIKNGMKATTKDVDIVFQTDEAAREFIDTAQKQGFVLDKDIPEEYKDLDAITVLRDADGRRFDVFVKQVLRGLVLTPEMKERGMELRYGNLVVLVGVNEDIFLFKSITSRPADLEDMQRLAETGAMDWDTIIGEANNQPTPWRWIGRLYGRLRELEDEAAIVTPITAGLELEAEIAAAIEILIPHLQEKTLTVKEAAAILREEDMEFVKRVFAKMERYGLR